VDSFTRGPERRRCGAVRCGDFYGLVGLTRAHASSAAAITHASIIRTMAQGMEQDVLSTIVCPASCPVSLAVWEWGTWIASVVAVSLILVYISVRLTGRDVVPRVEIIPSYVKHYRILAVVRQGDDGKVCVNNCSGTSVELLRADWESCSAEIRVGLLPS
jgi:hypothetical protein